MTQKEMTVYDNPDLDEFITTYIGTLLERYDTRLLNGMEELGETLGELHILVDDGTIASRIADRYEDADAMHTIILCLPTAYDAWMTEFHLASWVFRESDIEDVIKSYRPSVLPEGDNTDLDPLEYLGYVELAAEAIANIFLNATLIPPESFFHMRLCSALRICNAK